jgi:hypothetical protein
LDAARIGELAWRAEGFGSVEIGRVGVRIEARDLDVGGR